MPSAKWRLLRLGLNELTYQKNAHVPCTISTTTEAMGKKIAFLFKETRKSMNKNLCTLKKDIPTYKIYNFKILQQTYQTD